MRSMVEARRDVFRLVSIVGCSQFNLSSSAYARFLFVPRQGDDRTLLAPLVYNTNASGVSDY